LRCNCSITTSFTLNKGLGLTSNIIYNGTLFYTNANSLPGKIAELRSRVEQEHIDIIGIVESFGRSEINDGEFYKIRLPDVDRKTGGKGGGLIIYAKDTLSAIIEDSLGTEFQESLWCVVKLKENKILIGLCYRSPSSTVENNKLLLNLLDQASSSRLASQMVIMGDFNYHEIDYVNNEVNSGPESEASKFFYKTHDLALTQHVVQPTRVRQGQRPSLLDYLFSSEENLIEQVNYEVPIGKSDHVCLRCAIKIDKPDKPTQIGKLDYWKGDYQAIN
jgi:hypothetical protein